MAQDIEVYDVYDDFAEALIEDKDKVYVVNYWATWCAPCVKELPYFEDLHTAYDDSEVEVVLVSIDFKNQYEKRLVPFLQKNEYSSRLIHMADPKANDWIGKVDPDWTGTIPATLFIKGGKVKFVERAFSNYGELKKELDHFLNS